MGNCRMTTEAKRGPSEGIYYVVCEPAGWRLAAQIFPPGEDHTHQEMWECDLVPDLSRQWAEKLHEELSELQSLFKLLTFAFFRRGSAKKSEDGQYRLLLLRSTQ